MKSIPVLIAFILFNVNVLISQAQISICTESTLSSMVSPKRIDKYTVLDSSLYQVTYEVEIVNDTAQRTQKEKDIQVLLIGEHISKFYSRTLFESDSVCSTLAMKGQNYPSPPNSNIPPAEIFKDYTQNTLSITYRTFCFGPTYLYVEDKIPFNWTILSERKKVLTYNCQKATTTFRGRDYIAWFTTEIPISEGPYKFAGLPGLILHIYDTKGEFQYLCKGFQKTRTKLPIKLFSWKYETTTRAKLNALLVRIHDRSLDFAKTNGIIVYKKGQTGSPKPATINEPCPFNPIELE